MSDGRRHPTDEERARESAPTVAAAWRALRAGDAAGLRGTLRDDAEWLSPEGVVRGADAVAGALLSATAGAEEWREPVQLGAAAALGFSRGGVAQAVLLTVRREGIVLAAGAG